jgi:hypothetical protein
MIEDLADTEVGEWRWITPQCFHPGKSLLHAGIAWIDDSESSLFVMADPVLPG